MMVVREQKSALTRPADADITTIIDLWARRRLEEGLEIEWTRSKIDPGRLHTALSMREPDLFGVKPGCHPCSAASGGVGWLVGRE